MIRSGNPSTPELVISEQSRPTTVARIPWTPTRTTAGQASTRNFMNTSEPLRLSRWGHGNTSPRSDGFSLSTRWPVGLITATSIPLTRSINKTSTGTLSGGGDVSRQLRSSLESLARSRVPPPSSAALPEPSLSVSQRALPRTSLATDSPTHSTFPASPHNPYYYLSPLPPYK